MANVQKMHPCTCGKQFHSATASYCCQCGRKLDASNLVPDLAFEALIRKLTGSN